MLDHGRFTNHPLPVTSSISSKGQITVPVELRRLLGLHAGTVVRFEARADGIFLRKGATADAGPVDRLYGTLRLEAPVDKLMDAMRGPRPRKR